MSRVERTEQPSERRGSEPSRHAEPARGSRNPRTEEPKAGPNPSKAEGEESDIEQALERQAE